MLFFFGHRCFKTRNNTQTAVVKTTKKAKLKRKIVSLYLTFRMFAQALFCFFERLDNFVLMNDANKLPKLSDKDKAKRK